jgi:hypothetical protein
MFASGDPLTKLGSARVHAPADWNNRKKIAKFDPDKMGREIIAKNWSLGTAWFTDAELGETIDEQDLFFVSNHKTGVFEKIKNIGDLNKFPLFKINNEKQVKLFLSMFFDMDKLATLMKKGWVFNVPDSFVDVERKKDFFVIKRNVYFVTKAPYNRGGKGALYSVCEKLTFDGKYYLLYFQKVRDIEFTFHSHSTVIFLPSQHYEMIFQKNHDMQQKLHDSRISLVEVLPIAAKGSRCR